MDNLLEGISLEYWSGVSSHISYIAECICFKDIRQIEKSKLKSHEKIHGFWRVANGEVQRYYAYEGYGFGTTRTLVPLYRTTRTVAPDHPYPCTVPPVPLYFTTR